MNATALSCQELVELVTDYLEGALPEAERIRFDDHLGGCDGCSAYLSQMRATIVADRSAGAGGDPARIARGAPARVPRLAGRLVGS